MMGGRREKWGYCMRSGSLGGRLRYKVGWGFRGFLRISRLPSSMMKDIPGSMISDQYILTDRMVTKTRAKMTFYRGIRHYPNDT